MAWMDALLSSPPPATACETVSDWWPRHLALAARHVRTMDLAIAGGFESDRVAWAFASAYQAALRALVPDLSHDVLAALCVTEATGNAPRDIKTTLSAKPGGGWVLDGAKRWTTLGPGGQLLLVAARDAEASTEERPALRLVRVPGDAAGVHIDTMPPTPFVPEVPHARLRFESVTVREDALLPGDGYARYVKPFRTVEDLHVHAAILSYLVGEARRRHWPNAWVERAVATLCTFSSLADQDPSSSAVHVALAGALATGEQLAHETDAFWSSMDEAATRWGRDRALMGIAGAARKARAEAAWKRLIAS